MIVKMKKLAVWIVFLSLCAFHSSFSVGLAPEEEREAKCRIFQALDGKGFDDAYADWGKSLENLCAYVLSADLNEDLVVRGHELLIGSVLFSSVQSTILQAHGFKVENGCVKTPGYDNPDDSVPFLNAYFSGPEIISYCPCGDWGNSIYLDEEEYVPYYYRLISEKEPLYNGVEDAEIPAGGGYQTLLLERYSWLSGFSQKYLPELSKQFELFSQIDKVYLALHSAINS